MPLYYLSYSTPNHSNFSHHHLLSIIISPYTLAEHLYPISANNLPFTFTVSRPLLSHSLSDFLALSHLFYFYLRQLPYSNLSPTHISHFHSLSQLRRSCLAIQQMLAPYQRHPCWSHVWGTQYTVKWSVLRKASSHRDHTKTDKWSLVVLSSLPAPVKYFQPMAALKIDIRCWWEYIFALTNLPAVVRSLLPITTHNFFFRFWKHLKHTQNNTFRQHLHIWIFFNAFY